MHVPASGAVRDPGEVWSLPTPSPGPSLSTARPCLTTSLRRTVDSSASQTAGPKPSRCGSFSPPVLPMGRGRPGRTEVRIRRTELRRQFDPLRRRAVRWVADHQDALRIADPAMPAELDDRQADNWRPLLAIADAAGSAWAALARRAARTLAGSVVEADQAAPVPLLADLRDLFATAPAAKLATAAILRYLATLADRPWADYAQGEPLTPRQLARLLDGFNIKARQIRQGSATRKGYVRADFIDVFRRYLPSETPKHPHDIADLTSPPNGRRAVVDKDARCAHDINHVSDVSDLFDEA